MNKLKSFSQSYVLIFSAMACIITILIYSINFDTKPLVGFYMLITHIVTSALTILLMIKLSLFKDSGFQAKGFWKGFLFGTPFLVIGLLSAIFSNLGIHLNELSFNGFIAFLLFTLNMFMVGVGEEVLIRGLILNNMVQKWGSTRSGILKAVLLSSIIFGLFHLDNIFVIPPLTILVQIINATSAGILFAAVYIRSKNIWSVIIIHALVDWIALFLQQCFTGTASIISLDMSVSQAILFILAGSIPPVLIGLFLLRKSKHKEII